MYEDFKYADLLNDEVFKLVFGQESTKDVMITFLNHVITDRRIIDLEFIDKEMHPMGRKRKGSVYDLFCITDDGSRIIVEIQRQKQETFAERTLYYSTFQISRQIDRGTDRYELCPVYLINILDFRMDENKNNPNVKTVFRLYEENEHSLLTDRITFIFLELPKFCKKLDELDGNILEGMYFCLKNMYKLKERPKVLDHDVFKKIFEVSELYNMDEETRFKILENMTTERDLRNQMSFAKKEGQAEGQDMERKAIALKLLQKGIPVNEVAELTSLHVDEVTALQ